MCTATAGERAWAGRCWRPWWITQPARGYRTVIGGIDADNAASIALHLAQGFAHAGTIRDAGYKFGRWLNLAFYQKLLPGPERPTEGQE